jgi:glycerol-3-phosphate acyltransferase PlsY
MKDWLIGLGVFAVAYFVGGIPFGLIAGRLLKGVDIRTLGSGNIGATNAARVIGFKWFPVILALDALKGFAPTALAGLLNDPDILGHSPLLDYVIVAAVGAMLGHTFSPYLKFKGGKGVATGLGVMLALTGTPHTVIPLPALCAFGVFLLALVPTRMMSAASIIAAASLPAWYWLFTLPDTFANPWRSRFVFLCAASVFVVFKHRGNMVRIVRGVEPKLGRKADQQQV